MKDNFSTHSHEYARYRPTYPQALFQYLYTVAPANAIAWDCGTGNGQVAIELARHFNKVYATDISKPQIDNAQQAPNIIYSVQPAESTYFDDQLFDLVVIAQAIHWFEFDKFYAEVRRTVKKGGIICVTGYGMISVSPGIDALINDLYTRVIGQYWDKERHYVDEHYRTIPFPFEELPAPELENRYSWTPEHLTGYLRTWSAVKHFIKANGYDPVDEFEPKIARLWDETGTMPVNFPVLLRVGRV